MCGVLKIKVYFTIGLVMAEIFDYDDYRDMIKDYYLEHKKHNSLYSFSTPCIPSVLSARRLAWIQVTLTTLFRKSAISPSTQSPPQKKCSGSTVAEPHTSTC